MAQLGKRNTLPVLRLVSPGLILEGGAHGDILLPTALAPAGAKSGDHLDVFVYRDSEDRIIATFETPYVEVGQFAFLRVVGLHPRAGAFLDWGLAKDLLLPLREMKARPQRGDWLVVYVRVDMTSDRIVATERFDKFLDQAPPAYREGEPVKLLVHGRTPLGYKAIVNDAHTGLLYENEVGAPLQLGQGMTGYIRRVREDGKLDLGLDQAGHTRIEDNTGRVLEALRAAGGRMAYGDDSAPESIRAAFGMSKKAFKQAIGTLYKARRLVILPNAIRLADSEKK
jgi:uncharacterized protein